MRLLDIARWHLHYVTITKGGLLVGYDDRSKNQIVNPQQKGGLV